MPVDFSNYPENWGEIRAAVLQRAKNADGVPQCECMGECGLHCHTDAAGAVNPGQHPRRCVELNGRPALWAKGTIVLTTAHLCNDPGCPNTDHMKAMCQRCHLRIDEMIHRIHRRQRLERETGQQRLVED